MINFIKLGLTCFTVHIPIAITTLLIIKKDYKSYSPLTHWISNLGEDKFKNRSYFDIVIFLLGFLGIFFPVVLSTALIATLFSQIGIGALCVSSVCIMTLVFFPIDKNFSTHAFFSKILFWATTISGFTLIQPMISQNIISPYLLFLILPTVAFGTLLVFGVHKIQKKYGKIPVNLVEIRPVEKSFIPKNVTVWEWLSLSFFGLSYFVLSFIMLGKI